VYLRGGHEWPPFLLVVILMFDPALLGAEMPRQQLFMSVVNRTKLTKTNFDSAGRYVERSGFRQELHA